MKPQVASYTGVQSRRFEGQVAIVTAGANGMGRAQAVRLAAEGAKVAIFDIDEISGFQVKSEIVQNGGTAEFFKVDLTKREDVELCFENVKSSWGRVTHLFSNAGIVIVKAFTETTDDDFDRMMDLNLRSAFLITRKVIPHMIEHGGGSIVIMSSFNASRAVPMESIYSVSKAAVEALAKNIAVEHRNQNIRCNAIAPAFVRTNHGLREIEDFKSFGIEWTDQALAESQLRVCEPDEVADIALFAASNEANFMNGTVFSVDNGWTAKG